jgi:hypothetical protein
MHHNTQSKTVHEPAPNLFRFFFFLCLPHHHHDDSIRFEPLDFPVVIIKVGPAARW